MTLKKIGGLLDYLERSLCLDFCFSLGKTTWVNNEKIETNSTLSAKKSINCLIGVLKVKQYLLFCEGRGD